MSTYLIGYDLNRPRGEDDYPKLIEKIKTFGTWWHHLDSTFIIKSDKTAAKIRDELTPFLDDGDELLVVGLSGEGAWRGFADKGSTWLKDNL